MRNMEIKAARPNIHLMGLTDVGGRDSESSCPSVGNGARPEREPRTQCKSPSWVTGTQLLEPLPSFAGS